MASLDDVRRIASRLPGAKEGGPERFGFSIEVKGKDKGFLWSWAERVDPRKARVPNNSILAIVVPNLSAKDFLMEADPDKYVVDPHYNGFPAVLVRLEAVSVSDLEDLILEAWRTKAPPALRKELDKNP